LNIIDWSGARGDDAATSEGPMTDDPEGGPKPLAGDSLEAPERARITGELAVGDLVTRFSERNALASGGMSRVLRSFDRSLLRDVAVKVMERKYAGQELSRQAFLEEAQITAQLEHPNSSIPTWCRCTTRPSVPTARSSSSCGSSRASRWRAG
jgi:hypothetical protein